MTHIPLAASPVDRAAHHRLDPDWLAAAIARPDALVLAFQRGNPLMQDHGGLVWLGPNAAQLPGRTGEVFLGLDRQAAPIFAISLGDGFRLDASPLAGLGAFEEPRAAFSRMGPLEANLASTARSIFEWHRTHGFCAKCGVPSDLSEGGWKRTCPACRTEHFPRTDPVAIMLAVSGDKCLLGRQAGWPPGMWSCLAGFVEPGETPEQAAARELYEESGIEADADTAEYLFSQPWPFPSSLMVGLILQARSEEIRIDPSELESARWFTRAEARDMLAGTHPEAWAPTEIAIAHHILKAWAERD